MDLFRTNTIRAKLLLTFAAAGLPLVLAIGILLFMESEPEILKHVRLYLCLAGALLAVVGLVALALSSFVARRLLVAPLEQLVAVARAFQQGDLSARTGLAPSCREIEMLARSFDAMAESMEKRQAILRESEQKFSGAFELSPITMALTSYPGGTFVEVNRVFMQTFGFSREEALGKTTGELNMWASSEDRDRYIRTLREERYVSGFETVMRTRSGELITVEFTGSHVEIAGKNYLLNTVVDTTKRKSAERALLESEQRFKEFFEQSGDAFLILDDGRFIDCNRATIDLLGYRTKEEVFQCTPAELSPAYQPDGTSSSEKAAEIIARTLAKGSQRFEWSHLKADGSELPVEVVLTPMSLAGKVVLHTVWRDITERRRLEFREQTRLHILEEIAAGAPLQVLLDAIVCFAEQSSPGCLCSILLANNEGTRLVNGSAPHLPGFYNDAVDGLRIMEGMGSCGTAAFLRKRVVVEDLQLHRYWQGFQPARDAGLRACWSEPVLSSTGELLGTFAIYHRTPCAPGEAATALMEAASNLASIAIGRVRDNERHALLEDHIRQMQKFEAIGQLAGGIAHDFNNLLTPILVYAELMRRSGEDHAELKKIDGIISAASKAKELTQRLLSFGRKQVMHMNVLDLNEVILSFKEILGRTVRENIAFDIRMAPGGANILADRGQMEQILLNLAVNAQDAIKGNGSITVETGHVFFDDEFIRLNPGMKAGAYILLAFTDSGCGMGEEILQHVFEPFFTTKPVGQGTGLGLATVYGIIKQHEGYVKIRSRIGEGTTFTIYLPESFAVGWHTAGQVAARATHPQHDQTIMFVDDNEMILAMAKELLDLQGYRSVLAGSPLLALEAALSHEGHIDLLVTDVVMPEMNGPELFGRLAEMRQGLQVLYISGYKNDVVLRKGTLEEEVNFLSKPFTAEQLTDKIRQVLLAKAD